MRPKSKAGAAGSRELVVRCLLDSGSRAEEALGWNDDPPIRFGYSDECPYRPEERWAGHSRPSGPAMHCRSGEENCEGVDDGRLRQLGCPLDRRVALA